MTTELFLGGLIVLTMAAIVIVALTTDRRVFSSDRIQKNKHTDNEARASRSDR